MQSGVPVTKTTGGVTASTPPPVTATLLAPRVASTGPPKARETFINPKLPNLKPPQPHGMRFLSCSGCGTSYMTDEYIMIQCKTPDCYRCICLLDDCLRIFSAKDTLYNHVNVTHRPNGDHNQCYTCKAPKIRDGSVATGQCSTCGFFWCLREHCNFEFPTKARLHHHQSKH